MDQNQLSLIVQSEKAALQALSDYRDMETNFTCPLCHGNAILTLHEWLGYQSHCENGCF